MAVRRLRTRLPRDALSLAGLTVAASLLAPAAATAGRAQAGSTIGLYSSWDLVSGRTTGTGTRDGAVVQTVDVSGDPASASVQVYDGVGAAQVGLASQGALASPDAPAGLPFSGHRTVRADRTDGALQLGASSGFVDYALPPGFYRRQSWVSGYSFAEVFESFDLLYPASRSEPVTIALRLTIDGTMTGNDGGNGFVNGLQAYMILSNTDIDPGLPPGLAPPVWRTEASAAGRVLTLSGSPTGASCPVGKDFCESFFGLYAAIDLRSRSTATGVISELPTGAPFAADFTARLSLEVSPGVTVLQMNNRGEPETLHAWVNARPVLEPGAGVLMFGGLAGLGLVARRRLGREGQSRGS